MLSGGTLTASATTVSSSTATPNVGGPGGSFIQSGTLSVSSLGTLSVGQNGFFPGAMSLTAGSLTATSTTIGAGGTGGLQQSGGSSTFGTLSLAQGLTSIATVLLSGGSLTATSTIVGDGGTASFQQTAGSSSLGTLAVSSGCTITLSGGTLQASDVLISGTFAEDSTSVASLGTFLVGDDSPGDASLSAGSLTAMQTVVGLGSVSSGTFSQSGTLSVSSLGLLVVGDGGGASGTITVAGGSLTASSTDIGRAGSNGTFEQSGSLSASNLGTLLVGAGTGSTGVFSLSGGTLTARNTQIGDDGGNGSFLQNAGVSTLSVELTVGDGSGSAGTISLSGGSLTAVNTTVGSGSGLGSFLQSGTQSFSSLGNVNVGSTGTLSLAAGTMDVTKITSFGVITVSGGTLAITGVGSKGTGSITNLTISGNGVFDVGKSGFVMPYTGTSPIGELNPTKHTQTYPANSIQRYLQTAIDGGNWDDPGITSSAAEADVTGVTAVGAIDNGDLYALQGNNYTGQTWMGQSITSNNTVLVRFTYYGDTNLDGVVNSIDVDNLIQGFEGFGDGWLYGDFNYDGIVDSLDVTEMIIGYTGQGKPLGDAISPGQAQFLLSLEQGLSAAQISQFEKVVGVPEPAGAGLAVWAIAVGLRRRSGR